jgi:hypothetical protein
VQNRETISSSRNRVEERRNHRIAVGETRLVSSGAFPDRVRRRRRPTCRCFPRARARRALAPASRLRFPSAHPRCSRAHCYRATACARCSSALRRSAARCSSARSLDAPALGRSLLSGSRSRLLLPCALLPLALSTLPVAVSPSAGVRRSPQARES